MYTMWSTTKLSEHNISCYCRLQQSSVSNRFKNLITLHRTTLHRYFGRGSQRPPVVTVDQERELQKWNSWTKYEPVIVVHINRSCVMTTLSTFSCIFFVCFRGSRNGEGKDIYCNNWSLAILKLWWGHLLYASYVWEETEKQNLEYEFYGFYRFFALTVYYLSQGFKARLESGLQP